MTEALPVPLEAYRIALEDALRAREKLLAASGLPECPTLEALRTEMGGEFLKSGDQFERAAIQVIAAHKRDCPVCRAREEYVQRHGVPLPEPPSMRGGWSSPPKFRWIAMPIAVLTMVTVRIFIAPRSRWMEWGPVMLLFFAIVFPIWRDASTIDPTLKLDRRDLLRYALTGALVGGAPFAVILGISIAGGDALASHGGLLWWLLLCGLAAGAGVGSLNWLIQRSAVKSRAGRG